MEVVVELGLISDAMKEDITIQEFVSLESKYIDLSEVEDETVDQIILLSNLIMEQRTRVTEIELIGAVMRLEQLKAYKQKPFYSQLETI